MSGRIPQDPARPRRLGSSQSPSSARRTQTSSTPIRDALSQLDRLPNEIVYGVVDEAVQEQPKAKALRTLDALSQANSRAAAVVQNSQAVTTLKAKLDGETRELYNEVQKHLETNAEAPEQLQTLLKSAERVILEVPTQSFGQRRRTTHLRDYKVGDLLQYLGTPDELIIRNVADTYRIPKFFNHEALAHLHRLEFFNIRFSAQQFEDVTHALSIASEASTLPGGLPLNHLVINDSCQHLHTLYEQDKDPLSFLSGLTNLTTLDLSGLLLRAEKIAEHIAKLPKLTSLTVTGNRWSTNELNSLLGVCGAQLTELNLRGNYFNLGRWPGDPERGGPAHVDFARAPKLQKLILGSSSIDGAWLERANVVALKELRYLSVAWCDVESEDLERTKILQLPKLERIVVGNDAEALFDSL